MQPAERCGLYSLPGLLLFAGDGAIADVLAIETALPVYFCGQQVRLLLGFAGVAKHQFAPGMEALARVVAGAG